MGVDGFNCHLILLAAIDEPIREPQGSFSVVERSVGQRSSDLDGERVRGEDQGKSKIHTPI